MKYKFAVTAYDSASKTSSTSSCYMYSGPKTQNVFDIIILSENTKTGYIDFRSTYNSFKSYITNVNNIDASKLSYNW